MVCGCGCMCACVQLHLLQEQEQSAKVFPNKFSERGARGAPLDKLTQNPFLKTNLCDWNFKLQ